jgi:hypothetical protein
MKPTTTLRIIAAVSVVIATIEIAHGQPLAPWIITLMWSMVVFIQQRTIDLYRDSIDAIQKHK